MAQTMITARYELLAKLGQGGMGAVYKVRDRLTNETVALKQVLLSLSDLDFASRADTNTDLHIALTQEFRTLAGLRHPNIISVLDYGYDQRKQPFYTMEFVEGSSDIREVAEALDDKGKSLLLIELLQGLTYLHRHNIIHRDLKPDNIAVVNNQVKVLDFGLAIIRQEGDASQTGTIAGTLAYIAPELFAGKVASIASDLYAVGIIAYEIFASKHPFDTSNMMVLFNQVTNQPANVTGIGVSDAIATILDRLLAKSPEDRFAVASDAIEAFYTAIGEEVPPERVEIRESYLQAAKFVGREQQLEQLEAAVTKTLTGKGTAYLIGGESGVGKSRLIEELQTFALVKGMTILHGQGVAEGGLPYQLWREVARRLFLLIDIDAKSASILKDIVPDMDTLLQKQIADPPTLDSTAYHDRMIVTLISLFKKIDKPVLLILEDLQWARESLEPLKQLNQIIETLPIMIMANFRNDEQPDMPEQFPTMNVMTLERLNDEQIEELSTSMLGESGREPHLLAVLKRETEGNCFFMVEVVRALADASGHLSKVGIAELPEKIVAGGVQEVIRRRLNRLSASLLDWLKPVAVAGRYLDLKLVDYISRQYGSTHGQFTPEMTTHELRPIIPPVRDDLLLQFANVAVLEIVGEQWRFSHDKLREAILNDLSDEEQTTYHEQVATAIEAVYPDDATYYESLYDHWQQAKDVSKTIHYLEPVAQQTVQISSDFQRAVQMLNQGLDQLPAEDPRRVALWNLQAEAHWRQGDGEQAQTIAQQALYLAEKINDQAGLANSLNYLGNAVHRLGNLAEAEQHHQKSLTIRQQIDDQLGIAMSFLNLGRIADQQGRYEISKRYYQQSLAVFQKQNNQRLIGMTFYNLGFVAQHEHNYADAKQYYEKSLVILKEVGDLFNTSILLSSLAFITEFQGDYALAKDYGTQSLAISEQLNDEFGIAITLTNLYFVELELQDANAPGTLNKALQKARILQDTSLILELTVGYAWYQLQQFETTRTLEILGFVKDHPEIIPDVEARLNKIMPRLEALLPVEAIQKQMDVGKTLEQDTLVQEMIDELSKAVSL